MQTTPNDVLLGKAPELREPTVKALPTPEELQVLRQQRIRFDGYFTGPTW